MSSADKRSPSTDALETLGMIHFKPEHRDAIHLAVEAVVAGNSLTVGQKIGIIAGVAFPAGMDMDLVESGLLGKVPYHGIVDPFLPRGPVTGESFWFVMAPRVVKSLRHVWEADGFPPGE